MMVLKVMLNGVRMMGIISWSGLSGVEREDDLREVARIVCEVGVALHEFVELLG